MTNSLPPSDYPIIRHEDWSDNPKAEDDPLIPPIERVIITLESRFEKCYNTGECVARMKEIEDYYIKEGLCENLPYNFMVADDGKVYEGRGWNNKPFKSGFHEELSENTIDIGVLGASAKRLPKNHVDPALEKAKRFIRYHVKKKLIIEDYWVHAFEGTKRMF